MFIPLCPEVNPVFIYFESAEFEFVWDLKKLNYFMTQIQ